MPRPRLGLRSALSPLLSVVLAGGLVAGLVACTGSGDPTSAIQPTVTGTYVRATMTLLDTAAPCLPGVACAPEFLDCDGVLPFTIPKTWTVQANEASAGGTTPYVLGGDGIARIQLAVRGTDTVRDTGVALVIALAVDPVARTWTADVSPAFEKSFANVDTRCTRENFSFDPVTLFGYMSSQPSTVTVTSLPLTPAGDVQFATRAGVGLTGDFIEGTFTFMAANQQEFGQIYVANVRVDGCFRVQVPLVEQGVDLDPAATGGC